MGLKDKSKKIKGAYAGLEDDQTSKEQNNKRVKEEKSDEKLKRSYMLSKEAIQKIELIKVQQTGVTLSELIEDAIDLLYQQRINE